MRAYYQLLRIVTLILSGATMAGCTGPQVYSTAQHHTIALKTSELSRGGLAFITPSTVTTQEEDRQALALVFGDVLAEMRPDIPFVSLPETLSAVNRAGLTEQYKKMFEEYLDTGIFRRETLQKIAETTGVRYVGQLKLASFRQGSSTRWSILGVRLMETKSAEGRIFFQIWDSRDGTIVWEGVEELSYSRDTAQEKIVTFRAVVEQAARNLIAGLP